MAHVFDADWRPQWRVDLYAGYKSTRADDPPELPGQVPLLLEVLDAAGQPVAEAAGYEADDVIGTIAAAAGPEGPVQVDRGRPGRVPVAVPELGVGHADAVVVDLEQVAVGGRLARHLD